MIILVFIFQKLKLNFNFLKYINLEKQQKNVFLSYHIKAFYALTLIVLK